MRIRERWRDSTRFQDVGTAVATFLAGLAFNLVGLTGVWTLSPVQEAPSWWHTVLLAIGCLGMLGKRRHPLLALAVGVAVTAVDGLIGGSVALILVLFDVIFSVGLFASARARTAVTTAVFVVIGTASVVGGLAAGEFRVAAFIGLNLTTLLFVPLWWSANLRQQRQLGLLDAERSAREAVLAERAAMARDLHDVIAAHLSTTAIHSGAALARPADSDRDRATLRAVRTSSLAALEEMRSMIMLLRADDPAAADPTLPGGLDRLPDLVTAARAGGLRIETELREVPGLPAIAGHTVYRIVREALTNAAKHAPGSDVRLDVRPAGDLVTVTVTNTLTGGAALDHRALSSGTGLTSLRERAALLGGELTAGHDGETFTVRATLPRHPSASGS
ncbi:signal transduction histidine kinase [Actinoplanes octamycinicus]|uniref:histidine kinase n=1 Tax=Actinoplanes octamycinicus TaxID=135948 RepID=A0A7W7MCI5_9ACTN|nr:histidine kinase [Actinoplanes octamycinicus]MBB4745156.1 signal transduction histidine kinase [Actinoplanes octamycinicus]GIE62716.1 two-component sensor histidine kinase [Actinoplanes octamycinicus]